MKILFVGAGIAGSSLGCARTGTPAQTTSKALAGMVQLIHHDLQRSPREHVLTYELYTPAARRSEFQTITEDWMRASRTALEQHFPPEVARTLDAYIEGAALHITLDGTPLPREVRPSAFSRIRTSAVDQAALEALDPDPAGF